jgi:hypothetical protein
LNRFLINVRKVGVIGIHRPPISIGNFSAAGGLPWGVRECVALFVICLVVGVL